MDLGFMGFDSPLLHALHRVLDPSTEDSNKKAPSTTYVRDAEAVAATPADVIERLNSYVFQIDMPGWRSGDIRVQVEDDNVLVISGDGKPEEEKVGFKYLRKERRIGRLMRKFVRQENAITDKIAVVCQDGVLSVTVEKLEPPQQKKPRTTEVNICG